MLLIFLKYFLYVCDFPRPVLVNYRISLKSDTFGEYDQTCKCNHTDLWNFNYMTRSILMKGVNSLVRIQDVFSVNSFCTCNPGNLKQSNCTGTALKLFFLWLKVSLEKVRCILHKFVLKRPFFFWQKSRPLPFLHLQICICANSKIFCQT